MDTVEENEVTATLLLNTNTRVEILLKEYELCTNDANHLEEAIWTTAGILFTASIAGIGVLGGHSLSQPQAIRLLTPDNSFDIINNLLVVLEGNCNPSGIPFKE